MNKKTFAAIIAAILILCAISAFVLVRCTDAEDVSKNVSSEISESSASEPSDTSVEADTSEPTDVSETPVEPSNDPSEEPSEPSDDVSEGQGNNPSTPDENSKGEDVSASEASKAPETSEEESKEPECAHTWEAATCTSAKTCKECGATEGKANGHNWKNASCQAPKTCKTCGVTEGVKTAHDWKSATCLAPQTCNVCGTTTGNVGNHHYEDNACTHCGDKREVICGDTPVEIVVNGKEHTVESYEDAVEVVTLEDFENAEKGYAIVLELRSGARTFTANGDSTFVCSTTLRTYTAQRVYDFYINQWCPHCGKRKGSQGENGTCVRFLVDTDCPKCGEHCKALECHTCNEDND